MDQETLKALTRIGEIESRLAELVIEQGTLEAELDELHATVRAAGWTRARPRKAKAESTPAKKRKPKGLALTVDDDMAAAKGM